MSAKKILIGVICALIIVMLLICTADPDGTRTSWCYVDEWEFSHFKKSEYDMIKRIEDKLDILITNNEFIVLYTLF